jgi:predicted RNA-binding Zn-ribbon protein involved in translation (DUF1610 family)
LGRNNLRLLLVAVVLLGTAGYLFARRKGADSSPNPPAPVVCEKCGTEFYVKSNDEVPVCPNCGSTDTFRRLYFQCTQCGHVFVAFECKSEGQMVREPGGEWMPRLECSFSAPCPKCGGTTKFVRDIRKVSK